MATITPTTTASVDGSEAVATRSPRSTLRRVTFAAAAAAAVATTGVAVALHAAGVTFAIDGEQIPPLGFAQVTFLFSLIGGVLAGSFRKRSAHPRRRFVQTTLVLTAISCIPSVTAPASAGTRLALVVTHLVAAAIVIPVLARRLDA